MRNLNHSKNEKNDPQNSQKSSQNFSWENGSNFSTKTRWNSRTLEWLKIPTKKQKEFRDNLISVEVDYLQYTCYKISKPLIHLNDTLGFNWEIDSDNSNIAYNYNLNLAMERRDTKKWYAYSISFMSPWFPPIPVINIEVYNQDKVQLLKTEWKIVFYGAYFVFREIISDEAPEIIRFHNMVELGSIVSVNKRDSKNLQEKPLFKRTRVDIATDVAIPVSKKWLTKYIQPHKNSKHAIRHYNYDPITEIFQSVAYIPRLTQWMGIRVYNKIQDISNKMKQAWYPTYGLDKEHKIVTRIELVFAWDLAQEKIENIIQFAKYRILWDSEIKLKRKTRPKSQYNELTAYEYFKRYAKNHWKTLREVLNDVNALCLQEENKDQY